MKILMTGSTGLIGQSLGQNLAARGHQLIVVTRNKQKAIEQLTFKAEIIECDLNTTPLAKNDFDGVDALINLVGETIDGRWTSEKKKKILGSRLSASQNLILNCPSTVKTIVTASAQGYYGDSVDQWVDETSPKGSGFLSDVCEAWESVFRTVPQRLVTIRIGMVLTHKGGALKKLVGLFRKNLGAVLGDGRQWMSWVSLQDLVHLFTAAVEDPKYQGVVNSSHGYPVTNREFTEALIQELQTAQLPAAPSFVLKTVLGEMSEIVLSSTRSKSIKLESFGFKFSDTDLKQFLANELRPYRDHCAVFYAEQFIAQPLKTVFTFFAEAQNLEAITPPFLGFHIENMSTPDIQEGTLIDYKLKIRGVPVKWKTHIDQWNPPHSFVDEQIKGPYNYWHHTHTFKEVTGGTLITDLVRYRLPLGGFGSLVAGAYVESDVSKIFNYRREIITRTKWNE